MKALVGAFNYVGEGPSRGILRDHEIFVNLRLTFVSSSIIYAGPRHGLHQQLLPHPAQPRGQGRPASGAALADHHGHSRQEAGTRVTIVASSDHQ